MNQVVYPEMVKDVYIPSPLITPVNIFDVPEGMPRNTFDSILDLIVEGVVPQSDRTAKILSQTERKHYVYSALGYTFNEVANGIICSAETVISHRKNILHKLGANSMLLAIRQGFDLGLFRMFDESEIPKHNPLSETQTQILWMTSHGFNINQISRLRGIGTETVKTHKKTILQKLSGARRMPHAVYLGNQYGILQPEPIDNAQSVKICARFADNKE